MSEREPRFGEHFTPSPESRLDVLRSQENLPEYVKFGREIREKLSGLVETEGWPECPSDLKSIDSFFAVAREAVAKYWQTAAGESITQKCREFAEGISDETIKSLLLNSQKFEDQFKIYQFGTLEAIRKVNPEAWRSLVVAASERQLATLALLRHWAKEDLSPSEIKRLGLEPAELELFLDTAGILGKYIDHAYVKQIELADLPGGSSETKLGKEEREGAEYLYDIYRSPESDEIDIKTYSEVFPFEWPKIVSRMRALAQKAGRWVAEGKLPKEYAELPAYLEHLAELYGSEVTDPETLDKMWDGLYAHTAKLAESGCPLMIIAQGTPSVAGEADKVDVELRFGLRTPETKEAEATFSLFTEVAEGINEHYADKLKKPPAPAKVVLNIQPLAFGPNLYWATRGEASEERIVSHINAVADAARVSELPLLETLGILPEMSDEQKQKMMVMDTVLHEIGHTVMPEEDKAVTKRIGTSHAATILEEMKAEVVAMKLLWEAVKLRPDLTDFARVQLLARLGSLVGYLAHKSDQAGSEGEPYYLCGVVEIDALLKSGAVQEREGRWVVAEVMKGIEILGKLGDEIIEKLYANTEAKPADVKAYIKELKDRGNDPSVRKFISALK